MSRVQHPYPSRDDVLLLSLLYKQRDNADPQVTSSLDLHRLKQCCADCTTLQLNCCYILLIIAQCTIELYRLSALDIVIQEHEIVLFISREISASNERCPLTHLMVIVQQRQRHTRQLQLCSHEHCFLLSRIDLIARAALSSLPSGQRFWGSVISSSNLSR